MTSTENLILALSADLAPVQRRNPWREAGALLGLGAAEAMLLVIAGVMRSDMGRVILSPFMVWKIGGLAVLAGVCCAVAMRSFTPPGSARRGLEIVFTLAVLIALAGMFVTTAAESRRPLIERLTPAHGILCAVAITVLSLPMMALFARLMRRAAPVHAKRSAWATGLAASSCGALIFTLCCPANDPLYVIVWYSVAVVAVSAAARWILPRRFRL